MSEFLDVFVKLPSKAEQDKVNKFLFDLTHEKQLVADEHYFKFASPLIGEINAVFYAKWTSDPVERLRSVMTTWWLRLGQTAKTHSEIVRFLCDHLQRNGFEELAQTTYKRELDINETVEPCNCIRRDSYSG